LSTSKWSTFLRGRSLGLVVIAWALLIEPGFGQDIVSSQLRNSFGKNKVRYRDFHPLWMESEHLDILFELEFETLAEKAVVYLEEGYDHISSVMRHQLSEKPPIIIFKSHYDFQQTNIIQAFLPPGVAGFAEPLRYRIAIPFDGDLDNFRNVLVHELTHIFEYDILNRGPVRRITNPIANPPTWIMEGLAEYATEGMNTIDEMVLRDAVLTDQLIPLEIMDSSWNYLPNPFLAYKQSHSIMEYIAANHGPEKIGRILRVWDSQTSTDRLLERLLDMDMQTLDERWQAYMRKKYWPLLVDRDYVSEFATRVVRADAVHSAYAAPRWSLSGDMLVVLSTDGVETHVDIVRLRNGSLVERVTSGMRTADFDDLTFGPGTVAWAPDGHTIAFVAKKGPRDRILLWDMYDKRLKKSIDFSELEIIESLDWAPDSQRLAFVGTGSGQSDIYFVEVDDGDLTQITGTPQREDHPAWSPDGSQMAFSAKYRGQFDIRVHDLESGRSRPLITSPTDDLWPQWLPEGNKILFVSTRERINDLFLFHLETGEEYRLTRTVSGVMSPALSPDGKEIVLATYYHSRRELYRMDMPSWPEIKTRSDLLAARAQEHQPASPVPDRPARIDSADTRTADAEVPDTSVSDILASDTLISGTSISGAAAPPVARVGLADAVAPPVARVGLSDAVALLDQKARDRKAVKLAQMTSSPVTEIGDRELDDQPVADVGEALPLLASSPAAAGGSSAQEKPAASSLPRRQYAPQLEFDGVSVQMGYFNGFLSGIAQLGMSDLLGNHNLNVFTDYVGSQEISNDFTFAASYTYYGRRPTYNFMLFNWSQFFNDNSNLYFSRGRLVQGLARSRQSGLLADYSYPIDVYRRVELSYTFVNEQREIVFPVTENLESFTTHLFKASYIHDSLSQGLLGPTSGRRYYLSVGRTLGLGDSDRSFSHLEIDYRHYERLGRWSVLGLRGVGLASLGRDGLEYNLGGPAWFLPFSPGYNLNVGPLRGYSFSELTGSRVTLLNSEIRVPFIRNITFGWPGTFSIPAVDGSLFLDVGGAWSEGEELDLWPLQPPGGAPEVPGEKQRLHVGMGFGLLVYFLAPLNFEFAKQTDLKEFGGWRTHFSFGKSF